MEKTRPIRFSNRPFCIEPLTGLMLPDGIFDSTVRFLEIAFYVTNQSAFPLRWAWVRPDFEVQTEWLFLGNTFIQLGRMAPGTSRLVKWKADFSACTPGKKSLGIEFGLQRDWDELGGGGDGFEQRTIFVSRTTKDEETGVYRCEVPEGALQLKMLRKSMIRGWEIKEEPQGDNPATTITIPSIGVLHEIEASVISSPGNEDNIPFADPWWKIVAWIVAVLAGIAALIAAKEGHGTANIGISGDYDSEEDPDFRWCVPDPTKQKATMELAGILSIISTVAMRVGLMDVRDPFQKGRDAIPKVPGDHRALERVHATIMPPAHLRAGDEWGVPIEWTYSAVRQSGEVEAISRSETGFSDNIVRNEKIEYSREIKAYQLLWIDVYLETKMGVVYAPDVIFGRAIFTSPRGKMFRMPLANYDAETLQTLPPGHFRASLHTEMVAGQLGRDAIIGDWTIELFVQNVNAAPPGLPPFEAATFVGGDVLLAPIQIRQVAKDSDRSGRNADEPHCEPDKTFKARVLDVFK